MEISIIKKSVLYGFLVAACVWYTTLSVEAKAKDHRPAQAAVLLDLSGGQASIGRPAMNGFLLAFQETDLEQDPFLFISMFNTQSDPQVALQAAQKTVSSVSVAAGFTDNDSLLVAGPVFQEARVPFLSIGATDPTLPDVIGDAIFLTSFGDNTQAAAAAEFAHTELGPTVAVLWDTTAAYTRTLPIYFRIRFEELGGSVLLNTSFDGGCNISALGELIRNLSPPPDFIYLAALPDCAGELVESLRSEAVWQPIIGGDGLDTPNLLEGPLGVNDNVYYTTHAWLSPDTGTPQSQQFIEAYQQAYGNPPEDAFAALGYDAGNLLLTVLNQTKNKKSKQIKRALEQTQNFLGVTGTIGYSRESHVPLKTVWTIKVTQGQRSLVTAFIPKSVPAPIE